jgi:tRNA(adenine34) deaminase
MLSIHSDEYFMKLALKEAEKAFDLGEIPVGAVVVWNKQVIAKAHNTTEQLNDATAHAEMIALTAASNHIGSKFLNECTLFVTLEPCPMCAGAIFWTRIKRLCYAASDDKGGFMRFGKDMLHNKTTVQYGLKAQESAYLLKSFFKEKRIQE